MRLPMMRGRLWRLLWAFVLFVVAGVTALLANAGVWVALAVAVFVGALHYAGFSARRLGDEQPAFPRLRMRRLPWIALMFAVLCVIAVLSRQDLWVAIAIPAAVSALVYGVWRLAPLGGEH